MADVGAWEVLATPPGSHAHPSSLPEAGWRPAPVPGTAAAAVAADVGIDAARAVDYDAHDWWWRGQVALPHEGRWEVRLGGAATASTLWLDGEQVAGGESMWHPLVAERHLGPGRHQLVLRCAALEPLLGPRRPRPRWRSALVSPPSLRWWRTSALGRMPGLAPDLAPVGPWRPVQVREAAPDDVTSLRLRTSVVEHADGTVTGVVDAELRVRDGRAGPAVLHLAGRRAGLVPGVDDPARRLGRLELPDVARWWPHGYGPQALHDAAVEVDGRESARTRVGFRSLQWRRDDGSHALVVNGVPVFARGACWVPGDVVGLHDPAGTRAGLARLRDAGLVMVRVTGTAVYEDDAFWDACDELGLLVWQDAMLASLDPPDDPAWLAGLHDELVEVLSPLAGRPSLAVVCGGAETEQQPAMLGLDLAALPIPALTEVVPAAVAAVVPGTPYVTSSPSGGALPFHVGAGVAQYFGVGAYRRPPLDVRSAGVRFASECLALATPPERSSMAEWFGPGDAAERTPAWLAGVPRDAGAAWHFEDVVDHYVRTWAGHDPDVLRREDPGHALDVSRATSAALMAEVLGWWRRPASGCAGALVLSARDLRPGAGWGLLDAAGRPKAPWWVLRRLLAPTGVILADLGLDGIEATCVNDTATALRGSLAVRACSADGTVDLRGQAPVAVPAHGSARVLLDAVVGFRDLGHAYAFGPRTYDAVEVTWLGDEGAGHGAAVHLVGGPVPPRLDDVGLRASARRGEDGGWTLHVRAERLAPWVVVDLPGWVADDSWFTLLPGDSRDVVLRRCLPADDAAVPSGSVRAVGAVVAGLVEVGS